MISIPGTIPIRIYPFFWFLAAAIGWMSSGGEIWKMAVWVGVIVFSVLIHEYGHALTARYFGQQAHIELVGLGGVTHRKGRKLKLWQEFIIVLNGPLFGFLLFIAASIFLTYYENTPMSVFKYTLLVFANANLFWTILNLLPVHPLDGGRLFGIIMESLLGIRGLKIALFLSSLFALGVSILFFTMSSLLAGSIFLMLAYESYRAWKSTLAVSDKDQDGELQQILRRGEEEMLMGNQEAAQQSFKQVRESVSKGILFVKATEYLAAMAVRQARYKEAYDLLKPVQNKISLEALHLLHQSAYLSGAWQEAVGIGNQAYQLIPSYDTALINAFCYGLLDEARPAIGWLQRAVSDGLPNLRAILTKKEFDKIRNSGPFIEFVQLNL